MDNPFNFLNYDFNALQNPSMAWGSDLPSMFAGLFSKSGISPGMFLQNPSAAAQTLSASSNPTPSLGTSLSGGVPLPTPDPRKVGGAMAGGSPGEKLTDMLKGIKSPGKPDVVKPSTPPPPRASGSIKSGELESLINSLMSGGRAGAVSPLTLGSALSKFRGY